MTRPTRCKFIDVTLISGVLSVAGGAQRRKKKSSTPPSPVGSEVEIHVNGDEVRMVPGLGKAGIVARKSIVLLFERDDLAGSASRQRTSLAFDKYMNATRANDPDGIDVRIKDGDAIRLDVGTKVRVLETRAGFSTVAGVPVTVLDRGRCE